MAFLNCLFPQKIRFPDSKYNQNLVVIDYGTSATLFSENLIESGKIMTHIWSTGLRHLLPGNFSPRSALLLGLAGGSNATLISQKYPQAKIVGVDIDPVMIEIGRKHFGLGKIKNLKLVVEDARTFVRRLEADEVFDLVLLDCFIGDKIPPQLENLKFIKNIKDHSRYLLINHLWWRGHQAATLRFMRSLATKFVFTKAHTWTNTIISLV